MRSKKGVRAAALIGVCMLALTGCARSDAKSAYEKGCEALKRQETDSAMTYFNGVVQAGYYLPEAYRALGLIYLGESDYADACVSFEKSLNEVDGESDSFIRDVSLYLAFARDLKGEPDQAMTIYDGLIRKSPDAEVLFLRGRLHVRNGEADAAKADFDQAVSLSSDYDLYINIYEVYASEEKSGDGSDYLEKALAEAQKQQDAFYEQGLVNYYLENYDDAKQELTDAIKKDGSDMKPIFLLGKVYLATGDVANARAVYKQYTGTDGAAADAWNGLALCDMAEQKYDDALTDVENGLKADSSNQGLRYNEIVILEEKRQWADARAKAASYVASFPTDEAGLREYEFLSTR